MKNICKNAIAVPTYYKTYWSVYQLQRCINFNENEIFKGSARVKHLFHNMYRGVCITCLFYILVAGGVRCVTSRRIFGWTWRMAKSCVVAGILMALGATTMPFSTSRRQDTRLLSNSVPSLQTEQVSRFWNCMFLDYVVGELPPIQPMKWRPFKPCLDKAVLSLVLSYVDRLTARQKPTTQQPQTLYSNLH